MNQDPLDELERLLASAPHPCAPAELRGGVLSSVERELRAARWDRRLMHAAASLLVVGIGLNMALVRADSARQSPRPGNFASEPSRDALIETAIAVSESTDAATGRRFAEQWAAYSGRELTAQELKTLDSLVTKDRG